MWVDENEASRMKQKAPTIWNPPAMYNREG